MANEKYCQYKLAAIYDYLKPDSLSLKIDNKLIKITSEKPEYFFLLVIISMTKNFIQSSDLNNTGVQNVSNFTFRAASIYKQLQYFPEEILPSYRKRRDYISGLMSRNEIDSKYPKNKQLFIRIDRDLYGINEQIMLKVKDKWLSISDKKL